MPPLPPPFPPPPPCLVWPGLSLRCALNHNLPRVRSGLRASAGIPRSASQQRRLAHDHSCRLHAGTFWCMRVLNAAWPVRRDQEPRSVTQGELPLRAHTHTLCGLTPTHFPRKARWYTRIPIDQSEQKSTHRSIGSRTGRGSSG